MRLIYKALLTFSAVFYFTASVHAADTSGAQIFPPEDTAICKSGGAFLWWDGNANVRCKKIDDNVLRHTQLMWDYAKGDTPESYNADVAAAAAAWPPLFNNPGPLADTLRLCSVDKEGHLSYEATNSSGVSTTCGMIMCAYKTKYMAAMTMMTGNCGVNDLNCGAANRKGFGLGWSCMYSLENPMQ